MTERKIEGLPQYAGLRMALVFLWLHVNVKRRRGPRQKLEYPQLFTIPQDQLSHVQVLTVEPTTLVRILRLTGAVAYNGFKTTPVITQVSGKVSRIVVVPGRKSRGEPMMYVSSPDYSQLRTNYLKAKDAYLWPKKLCSRQRSVRPPGDRRKDRARGFDRVQAGGDLASTQAALKVMGITDPEPC